MPKALITSVTSSARTMFGICAFVIFFTVVVKMLFLFGLIPALAGALGFIFSPFGLTAGSAEHLLTGLIELTSGLWELRGSASTLAGQLSMAAFMLGWAGLSIHCQVLLFIGESGLKAWTYLAGKGLHALVSAVYVYLMAGLFRLNESISETLAEQIEAFSRMDFHHTLAVSFQVALAVWVFFLGLVWIALSRRKRLWG